MRQHHDTISVATSGAGLREITNEVADVLRGSGLDSGSCTLLVQHTSASLTVQENADPSARRDLEAFLARLVPEGDPLYEHVAEGPDDMPAHVRSALTLTSLTIPFEADTERNCIHRSSHDADELVYSIDTQTMKVLQDPTAMPLENLPLGERPLAWGSALMSDTTREFCNEHRADCRGVSHGGNVCYSSSSLRILGSAPPEVPSAFVPQIS